MWLLYLRFIIGGRELLSFCFLLHDTLALPNLYIKRYLPIYEPLDETMCIEISLPSRMEISIHKPFGSKHIDSLRLLPFYSPSSLCLYGWCMEWLQYDSIINLCNTNDKNMSMEAQFIILFFLLLPFFLCF